MTSLLRIGTRGSPLALAQSELVRAALAATRPELAAPGAIELVVIRTTGDRIQDRALAEIGGKGLFTKEIDEALLEGRIDLAVHSMKDVPTVLPEGIEIAAVPERADPRDVLCSRHGALSLSELPRGCRVGTASLRRAAQLLAARPDLRVVPLRGNVHTRLAKLARAEVDATLLAAAGLARLGLGNAGGVALEPEEMLPAVGQGAIGIACRREDERVRALLAPLAHPATMRAVAAERAFLARLDGNCRTPVAALARPRGALLEFEGLLATPDGSRLERLGGRGPLEDAERLGREVAAELSARARTWAAG
ncbi:MAG: hydroxymethylbilane synthase [Geminicoccaceae bacterium]|nr:hydroxymethylbilane synthase [Geminicoccaceae bacterium]MCS7268090.1 hydroxymethylbilane synthase [Geminicoccaceae bacterium]MCX7629635.1 hydroxymethylbilane synthase [Geminicoccaceae bacterium]MDW8125480.1 hydroxymethylbilane synthase [Geminicoccaceae bacterium]MDW8342324.1 hydroxymethylbilane synthase [Geminicoccaceae bacterium]